MPSFYRLVDGTVEIDGVRMHQTLRKSPLQDAQDKVAALGVTAKSRVLDVCTGLGYSAIASARRGAKVTTIEIDGNVLEIAKGNADSNGLFSSPNIEIKLGDAFKAVDGFADCYFDFILHDPPRFSLAGELYSLAFYQKLFRVLKRGGRMFHYTGSPGARSGKRVAKGVKQRLVEAGFAGVRWDEGLQGFLCRKP
jgi:predicted methyltransferase